MPEALRKITPDDLLSLSEYEFRRKALKQNLIPVKKQRRVEVGPFATFYFENYATMWLQVQEMLRIEKGGAEQLAGELDAYNPLIPQGDELVATVMFEVPDAARRMAVLHMVGGIEDHMVLMIGGETIRGEPDADRENTSENGKASLPAAAVLADGVALAAAADLLHPDVLAAGHLDEALEVRRLGRAAGDEEISLLRAVGGWLSVGSTCGYGCKGGDDARHGCKT